MEADTGWSRGDIALARAAGLLLLGLGGRLSGLLIDRLGIRRLTALALGLAAGWMAIAAGMAALLIRRPAAPRLVPIPAD